MKHTLSMVSAYKDGATRENWICIRCNESFDAADPLRRGECSAPPIPVMKVKQHSLTRLATPLMLKQLAIEEMTPAGKRRKRFADMLDEVAEIMADKIESDEAAEEHF